MGRLFACLALCLLVAPLARAEGWRDLTGRAAPEVAASRWLNTGEFTVSNEALKGRVWLLAFFGVH